MSLRSCLWVAMMTLGFGLAATLEATVSSIILPATPTAAERHAAGQLQTYIGKITGETLPIVDESAERPAGQALVVGNTQSNLQSYQPESWPADTIYIGYGTGSDIAILGQGSQGTLFAAYEFLRDQGCRWYAPDNIDDPIIPQHDALVIPDQPKKQTPAFVERGWHLPPASGGTMKVHNFPWATQNGLNTMLLGVIVEYPEELGFGHELRGGHIISSLIPSGDHEKRAETFAAHPDWYPLVNGKRVYEYKDGRPVQACLSNPEVVDEVARQAIEYLRAHPGTNRFSVAHADEPSYWCECDACRKMDGRKSQWKANDTWDAYGVRSKVGPGPISLRYVTFANQVARKVAEACPGRMIFFYAYGSTVAPPTEPGWKLEPNVAVEYAYGDMFCMKHDGDDPKCETNAPMHKWLKGWLSTGNPVIFYDYPPTGPQFDVPAGFASRYQSLIQYTRKMGVIGWSGENQSSWAGAGLLQYLKARLLWNPDTDVNALIDEYCRDQYGPAAEPMRTFYAALEVEISQSTEHPSYGNWIGSLDEKNLNQLKNLLTDAEKKAQTPPQQRRVAFMRVALNSYELIQMGKQLDKEPGEQLQKRYQALRAATRELIDRYSVPATDRWKDQLAKELYRPPFEALSGKPVDGAVPVVWRFRTDPADEGVQNKWYEQPKMQQDPWTDIRVDNFWTEQGHNYHGVGWYATPMKIPANVSGRLWLLFGVLDGDAEIWVNGVSAGLLPGDPWDKPKAIEITSLASPGTEATVVVRVKKDAYAAGISKFAQLVVEENLP